MLAGSRKLGLRQGGFLCRMFNTLVEPVLSFGCQVWGPGTFCRLGNPLGDMVHQVQLVFSGVGSNTEKIMLLREFNQQPLMHHWVVLAARLWNTMCGLDAARLLHRAFRSDILLFKGGCTTCWTAHMAKAMDSLLGAFPSKYSSIDRLLNTRIETEPLKDALTRKFVEHWEVVHPDPRVAPSNEVTASTYANWVGMRPECVAPHLSVSMPYLWRRALVGLRVGMHALAVQQCKRRGGQRVPREERCCPFCKQAGGCEDLRHFLLECPEYVHIKSRYPGVFEGLGVNAGDISSQLSAVFNSPQQANLAQCVSLMLAHRKANL